MSLTFMRRMVLARSFSSSFMVIYWMASSIWGIFTYSRALTRRRVFSISSARSWEVFSISARRSISWSTPDRASTAPSSSPEVVAKP